MPPKAYSSFFFPHVSPTDAFRGRSFLSFDNADSFKEDDERSVFTTTATTISSFFPGSAASSSSSSRKLTSRSSSHPSLRPIPQPKPAPRTVVPPVPPPCSAPAYRTEYQHLAARPFTSPSKPRRKPVPVPSPSPPPRRMSTSTVSTGYRNTTRAKALASLEGRTPRRAHTLAPPIPLNARSFMPLSDHTDDEDEADVESEADEPKRRPRRGTIDSWFVGPPPSPSLSAVPSFLTNDSDESFDSPRPSMSSSSYENAFVDFEDVAALDEYEYDAWGVVGEKRPHWLKDVLE